MRRIALLSVLTCGTLATARAGDRPNFVWLVAEDCSKHYFELYDTGGAPTPRIAELAAHGLLFEHAFSNSPVCSVARTTLITGCYAPRIGTQFHRRTVEVPLPGDLRMFPAYLREAGYYTTNNSKKDYNAIEGPGVWDESSGEATWRGRGPGQPFFHMQSFGVSHESSLHFPAEDLRERPTETDPAAVPLAPYHPDTPMFRYTHARYLDRIREVDAQIGTVVDRLAEDGLLEDTFIFVFGDHGGVLPRSKGYLYETGLHVPLVVRVPGRWRHLVDARPGSRVSGFVAFVDFGPTLLNLAGLGVPTEMDGRPFLGEGLDAEEVAGRDEAFGYADRFDEKYDLVRSLRKGRYKYIRSYQPFNFDALQNNYRYRMAAFSEWRVHFFAGRLDDVQRQFFEPRAPEALYDLEADPHETVNLADDPAQAGTLAALRERLSGWATGLPDLSFYPESVLVERAFGDPVAFGRAHRGEIARLVAVADLQLVPFEEARGGIEAAMASEDPWERYWGLIVCSTHGEAAGRFIDAAERIAATDPEPLVRARAAEFLGLIGAADPGPILRDALAMAESGVEAALILNTVVMLRDGPADVSLTISEEDVPPAARRSDSVRRRLEYLAGRGD